MKSQEVKLQKHVRELLYFDSHCGPHLHLRYIWFGARLKTLSGIPVCHTMQRAWIQVLACWWVTLAASARPGRQQMVPTVLKSLLPI